jgi:hypothetical protein
VTRFIMMHKAGPSIEAGEPPSPELMAKVHEMMQDLASTGGLLAGEGLQPTAQGVRVRFAKGSRTVARGPFRGQNELVGSFALIRVPSLDDAVEWASRIGAVLRDVELYIGRVKEPWDLGIVPEPPDHPMRYLILRKADARSEAGIAPPPDVETGMRRLLGEMTQAGVLLASERLLPSARGAARLAITKGRRTVVDGPFAESKELIAGYCLMRASSKAEAMRWASRFMDVIVEFGPPDLIEVDVREVAEDDLKFS